MMKKIAFFMVFSVLLLNAPNLWAQSLDRQAIEAIVRETINKNPEIVRDALVAAQARDQAKQNENRSRGIAQVRDKLINSPHGVVIGNPKGDVTLVEFFDYNCGFCKRAMNDVIQLIEKDKNLRVVIKEFPVLGEPSMLAATVSVAYKLQSTPEKYWAFHRELMGQRRADRDVALGIAQKMGADMTRLRKDMEGDAIRPVFVEVAELAQALSLSGTPTYVLADEVIPGAASLASLESKIANVRKCGKTACS